jgi:hypothetical protein
MNNYVVVQQPNNHIVLGVNEDRITIVQIEEVYSDEVEHFYPSGHQIIYTTMFLLSGMIIISLAF